MLVVNQGVDTVAPKQREQSHRQVAEGQLVILSRHGVDVGTLVGEADHREAKHATLSVQGDVCDLFGGGGRVWVMEYRGRVILKWNVIFLFCLLTCFITCLHLFILFPFVYSPIQYFIFHVSFSVCMFFTTYFPLFLDSFIPPLHFFPHLFTPFPFHMPNSPFSPPSLHLSFYPSFLHLSLHCIPFYPPLHSFPHPFTTVSPSYLQFTFLSPFLPFIILIIISSSL